MNWLAIIVAAIATLGLGFVWYNPKVFGSMWMADSGMTEEKAKQGMPMILGLSLILAGVVAYFLATYGGYHGTQVLVAAGDKGYAIDNLVADGASRARPNPALWRSSLL